MSRDTTRRVGTQMATGAVCLMLAGVPTAYAIDIYEYSLLPKELVLYLAVCLGAIGWAVHAGLGRRLAIAPNLAQLPLLCFAFLAVLSAARTTHALDTSVELLSLATYTTLYLIAANAITLPSLTPILWANSLTALTVSVIGIWQYHNLPFPDFPFLGPIPSNGHPSATFGYRNFAAMYLVCASPLAFLHFLRTTRPIALALSGAATTLSLVYLVYTRTRGAWMGLAFAIVVSAATILIRPQQRAVWHEQFRGVLKSRRAIVAWICLACFLAMAPLPARFQDTGLQRFDEKKADITATVASVFQEHGSRGRWQMWLNTCRLIWDHPVLGVGPGGWKRVYPRYDHGAMIREESSPRRPHNDYLWIASEEGLLGLAAYLAFLVAVLVMLWRLPNRSVSGWDLVAPCFMTSVIATLGHACFSFPRERPQAAMFLFLLSGMAAAALSNTGRRRISRQIATPLLILAIGIPAAGAYLTWRRISFDRHFVASLLAKEEGNWEGALAHAGSALAHGAFRPHALILQGRGMELHHQSQEATAAYQKALAYSPYSWHALNGLGVAAKRDGDYQEATRRFLQALDIFPSSISVRSNLGALYRAMGDTARAEDLYRSVLMAAPGHVGANNNLGNLYKERNELDSAAVCYEKALETDGRSPHAHYNLADIFRKRGNLAEAMQHYAAAAELMPTEPRVHWAMGMTLEALGDTSAAEAAYRQVLSLGGDVPQAYYHLADLLYSAGRYPEAENAYREFLGVWQGDPAYAAYARRRIAECAAGHEERERSRAP